MSIPGAKYDGFNVVRRGIDSGTQPQFLPSDQLSFAVNVTMRGGSPHTRPGFDKKTLSFGNEEVQEAFEDGLFQGAGTYVWASVDTDDRSLLLVSISGRIYSIDVSSMSVTDLTLAGDPNSAILPHSWFEQGEMFSFIQNGQELCLIFDGSALRRAVPAKREVPVGKQMCYALGRLTVVLPDSRSFVVGNIVGSTEGGTAAYNFRDSIISFTENEYLNGGGVFTAGSRITAVKEVASLDSTLNQGPVQIFTVNGAYSANYPFLREAWFETQYPLVTGSLLSRGALSQESTININNDLWFRSYDGIRSLRLARRQFDSWGDMPLSHEVERILVQDQTDLLNRSSAILFDNRLLMTCSPYYLGTRGIPHRGLVALDFEEASALLGDGSPSYDGLWTGLQIFQLLTLEVNGQERAFAFALDPESKISLYEITKTDPFDNYSSNAPSRQECWIETASISFGEIVSVANRTYKKLVGGDMAISDLRGTVDFELFYRPDKYPVWVNWQPGSWSECAEPECVGLFCATPNQPQYRDPVTFNDPESTCVEINNEFQSNVAYSFQVKLNWTGCCQINELRVACKGQVDAKSDPKCGEQDCKTLQACPDALFEYQIP